MHEERSLRRCFPFGCGPAPPWGLAQMLPNSGSGRAGAGDRTDLVGLRLGEGLPATTILVAAISTLFVASEIEQALLAPVD